MRTLKGIITSSTFNRRTGEKHVTVVKPEDYIESSKPQHNCNTTYDPLNRQKWQRGGYLKRMYGR